jgi:hypothetical protein
MSLLLLFNQSLSDSGAVGQDVLDLMELLNQELQLQPGEADVTKGLLALNAAQDFFESLASQQPGILGSQVGSFTTTANTETITFPLGLMRVDRIDLMDTSVTPNVPKYQLKNPKKAGGHAGSNRWPWNLLNTSGTGEPYMYWTNGRTIYLNPIPADAYTLRWYGFAAQDNITASGNFMYPDICMLPFASFAVRLIKSGVDDPATDMISLAQETFNPVLKSLTNFNRDGAMTLNYTQNHST